MDLMEYSGILEVLKKFIKARDRTSAEVRSFLISKGFTHEIVSEFLENALDSGLVSDRRVIENSLELGVNVKKKGLNKIQEELLQRGLPEDKITEKMGEVSGDVVRSNCKELFQKKIRNKSPGSKEMKNCILWLMQKGYEEEMIFSIIRESGISIEWEE